jgi:hypothetical protein
MNSMLLRRIMSVAVVFGFAVLFPGLLPADEVTD